MSNRKQLKTETPLVAKRGRPSKTAPVYDYNGALLITAEQREKINELVDGIKGDCDRVQKVLLSASQKYFMLGEILYQVGKKATCHMTAVRFEEKTGIPARMVNTALKVYVRFADNPEALSGMTMRDVAMLIGDKKDIAENGDKSAIQTPYSCPVVSDTQEDFFLPTLSGVTLNNYRLHADARNGQFYVLKKGCPTAIPVASLTVEQPRTVVMRNAYNQFLSETQKALEQYYAAIEAEEGGNDE